MPRTEPAGHVLVLLPGLSDELMAGPEIRGWEVARALSDSFEVTVAAGVREEGTRDGLRIVPHRRALVVRELFRHDVVIAAWLPPFVLSVARLAGCATAADLYDPVEFELSDDRPGVARELRTVRELTRLQMAFADVLICGSRAQGERLEKALGTVARSGGGPALVCVPFGVPSEPADDLGRPGPLRERFRAIGTDDVVALWWGSLWHWLDPATPIRAMARLESVEPLLKLVLSVGPPPDPAARSLTRNDEMKRLAADLGLLDRSVFFLEDWIPYGIRSQVLCDVDLGIASHRNSDEAAVAVRARYLDFVWCGLPAVLSPGDEFGNELAARGAALPVAPGDVEAFAAALLGLARDPGLRRSMSEAAESIATERRWEVLVQPLANTLGQLIARGDEGWRPRLRLLAATARFYATRARDKVAGRLDSRATWQSGPD